MRILAIGESITGIEYHRIVRPLQLLAIEKDIFSTFAEDPVGQKKMPYPGDFDLVLFNRRTCDKHMELLAEIAKMKVPYIVDIDDYWKLPKHHPVSSYYKRISGKVYRKGNKLQKNQPTQKQFEEYKIMKEIENTIQGADGVTTTNETLAAEIRPLNKNVCVLPNAIDTGDYQWREKRKQWEGKRVGYFAGITHLNDAIIVGEALSILFKEHGIVTVYGGYSRKKDGSPNHLCESMAKRLNGSNEKMEVRVIPSMAPDTYGEMYTNVDVVIAPLENTKYNNCKSDLKVLEAQAYGLPIVCSNVLPYSEHQFSHGVYLTENTTEDWVEAILKALGHKDEERYTRSLSEVNEKRLEFYKRVIGESVRV